MPRECVRRRPRRRDSRRRIGRRPEPALGHDRAVGHGEPHGRDQAVGHDQAVRHGEPLRHDTAVGPVDDEQAAERDHPTQRDRDPDRDADRDPDPDDPDADDATGEYDRVVRAT